MKLVITPPCHGGGHGFEPRRSRKQKSHLRVALFVYVCLISAFIVVIVRIVAIVLIVVIVAIVRHC